MMDKLHLQSGMNGWEQEAVVEQKHQTCTLKSRVTLVVVVVVVVVVVAVALLLTPQR